jgi:hypothetical protein
MGDVAMPELKPDDWLSKVEFVILRIALLLLLLIGIFKVLKVEVESLW